MTTDLINPKTTHPKLRLVGLLMATALVATACGGGGGGDAAPPAGSPPAGSPPAASDVVTLADIEACPAVEPGISNTTWYTNCLVGKRLVGKDSISSEACELRLKAGGVFEYAKNGVVVYATKLSDWKNGDGTPNASGFYANQLSAAAGNFRLFKASLRGSYIDVAANIFDSYEFEINVQDNKAFPNEAGVNSDTVEFKFNRTTENCKLDNI
jgi:hypothetical protein